MYYPRRRSPFISCMAVLGVLLLASVIGKVVTVSFNAVAGWSKEGLLVALGVTVVFVFAAIMEG
jgi:hypothetical protein